MKKLTLVTTLLLCVVSTANHAKPVKGAEYAAKRFAVLDTNSDNSLNQKEYHQQVSAWMNKEGLTEEQQKKRIAKTFKRWDADKNGALSLEEFITMRNAKKKRS